MKKKFLLLLKIGGIASIALVVLISLLFVTFLLWPMAPAQPKTKSPYLHKCPCPLILAHQGASGHAPSNTIASFALAQRMRADVLELDVHMSKDGVVVVSHDATVDRMTNGQGLIKEKTFAELKKLDAGYRFTKDGNTFPYRGQKITIPTLKEVFKRFPKMRVNIEIKQRSPRMEKALLKVIQLEKAQKRVLIGSFSTNPTSRFQKLTEGQIPASASVSQAFKFLVLWQLGWHGTWKSPVQALQLPHRFPGFMDVIQAPAMISFAHKHNMHVHYWTVNTTKDIQRAIRSGADGIISDYPDRVYDVLHKMGKRPPIPKQKVLKRTSPNTKETKSSNRP